MEVLKAARDESRTALLVYASERAVNYESGDLPPQLRVSMFTATIIAADEKFQLATSLTSKQNFVRTDNLAFAAELEDPRAPKSTTPTKRKATDDTANNDDDDPNWGGYQDSYVSPRQIQTPEASILDSADPTLPPYTPAAAPHAGPIPTTTRRASSITKKPASSSYDDSIPISLRGSAPTFDPASMALDDAHPDISLLSAGQEMQQRDSGPSLVPRGSTTAVAAAYRASNYPTEILMGDAEEDAGARHVEFAE